MLSSTTEVQAGLSKLQITALLARSLEGRNLRKVLILPPDFSRFHSNAGYITCEYRRLLMERGCKVDIMPALGTHEPLSRYQWERMYPGIPYEEMLVHNWRTDVVKLGEVPASFMEDVTDGLWKEPVSCEVNRRVMDESYDLILSVGQVVPHEVIGMSNESKNLFVGVGGSDMISKSHMVSAVYGIENVMGKDGSPVRKLFDHCLKTFLQDRPILFVLTVTTAPQNEILTHGVFIGRERETLESAIALSQKKNITFLDRPIKKCVTYLPEDEFKTTWIGNKAVYRTRMAIDDGGELLVLAPGIARFGEDPKMDALIRKYGYHGTESTLRQYENSEELRANMGAAAHLIHASSDDRFSITYAVRDITLQEVADVGFGALDYAEAVKRYDPKKLTYGWNTLEDGEEIYFIPNPALGLWIDQNRFAARG